MTTNTTTNLPRITLPNRALLWLRWNRQALLYGLLGAAWVIAGLLVLRTLQGQPSAAQVVPTPALPITTLPIVVIQRAPTMPPVPTATPDGRVLDELARLREQVAQLQAAQAAPQVVYQIVNAPEMAAPTPEPEPYTVANEPPDDFYTTPPAVDPAAQQALIGSDPNALACGGSPFCGGLTNAEAQAAIDRQRAAQEHKEQP